MRKGQTFIGKDGRLWVSTGGHHPRLAWRNSDIEILERLWPCTSPSEIAELLGMSVPVVRRKVKELGLKRHPDFRKRANKPNLAMARLAMKLHGNKGWFKNGERRSVKTEFRRCSLVQRLDTGYIGFSGEIARQLGGDTSNVVRSAKKGWRFKGVSLKIYELLNTEQR